MAAAAMELADADKDGFLSDQELTSVPGLKAGIKTIDTDGDGKISQAEVESRIQLYADRKTAILPCMLTITYKGKPLMDANVKLVPEPFLEGVIEPAEGTSDFDGSVLMKMPNNAIDGVRCGFYRIEVTSADKQISSKYNVATEIGYEAAPEGYPPQTRYDVK